jgi:hypothetical protein
MSGIGLVILAGEISTRDRFFFPKPPEKPSLFSVKHTSNATPYFYRFKVEAYY